MQRQPSEAVTKTFAKTLVRMGPYGCSPNALAQPPTQTSRWKPMLQRAANTEPRPSSACLPLADPWPRPTVGPLDFRLAVMTLQTESSLRSRTTGEKYHPRPHHRPAV